MDRCGLRGCMAVALTCSRRSLVKVRGCVVGGLSHDRLRHSGAGRATMAVDVRDYARAVLLNSSAEMTGHDFAPALRASGKAQLSVQSATFNRNIHSIGVFDFASVKVASSFMHGNEQGAIVAYERLRPVTANPPEEFFPHHSCAPSSVAAPPPAALGKRDRHGLRSAGLRAADESAGDTLQSCRGAEEEMADAPRDQCRRGVLDCSVWRGEWGMVREGLGLHPYIVNVSTEEGAERGRWEEGLVRAGAESRAGSMRGAHGQRARGGWWGGRSVRQDLLFGNVTDGWEHGLPGWKNGVPRDVVDLIDALVGHGQGKLDLRQVPRSWRRWQEIGCLTSLCLANGSLTLGGAEEEDEEEGNHGLDVLMPLFTGGSHHAAISVSNSTILGDVWGTDERPGKSSLENVTFGPDAWIDKHLGGRINSSEWLESIGLRWDARYRDWMKPVKRVDGSVVYALWHETRFARDGARGGIPGRREDYPMFDPVSGRRIAPNETVLAANEALFETEYLGVKNYSELRPSARLRERLVREARHRKQAAEKEEAAVAARRNSWRLWNRDELELKELSHLHPGGGGEIGEEREENVEGCDNRIVLHDAEVQTDPTLLALGITPERERAINRLIEKIFSRHNLRDNLYGDDLLSALDLNP